MDQLKRTEDNRIFEALKKLVEEKGFPKDVLIDNGDAYMSVKSSKNSENM
ncbi:MAG: hypothetical protein HDT27_02000 [Subdoligranulum sp.]|nr:hypothetical protein [Subdoligranulum sp.]